MADLLRMIRVLRRFAATLGLFAMAAQITLAAVHYHGFNAASCEAAIGFAATGCVTDPSADGSSPAPSDTDQDCAICLGLALATFSILPLSHFLAAFRANRVYGIDRKAAAHRWRHRAYFSRAPPLALPHYA